MVYLDNAATTQVNEAVADVIFRVLKEAYGNPSSLYDLGFRSQKIMENARNTLSVAIGCTPSEVVFTGSGTESNNIAILGAARARRKWADTIIISGFEHPSVDNTVRALAESGFKIICVNPESNGDLDIGKMMTHCSKTTALVCCMALNNETGALPNVADLAVGVKEINPRTAFHCDNVQGFLKHKISLANIDTMSVSAHKVHGSKGTGALYVRKGLYLEPVFFGGGQESGLRSGTENIAGIAGFAKAIEMAADPVQTTEKVRVLQQQLKAGIQNISGLVMNSPPNASPWICNFSLPGLRSETVIRFLSAKGIYVSGGSACHKGADSQTLVAMGISKQRIKGAVRVSFDANSSTRDIDLLLEGVKDAWNTLARDK